MTSTFAPMMASLMSVTSSGRSSMSSISICICGLDRRMDLATSFNRVVLPALGGDTIIPRCPFPTGLTRSMTRMATLQPAVSRRIRSLGKMGVISSNALRFDASSMVYPLMVLMNNSALNFSCWVLILLLPRRMSPVFRPKRRIWLGATYTSFSPGR